MDKTVWSIVVVALFVLICGEVLIWGFYAIQKQDEQVERKVAEIQRLALVEIGQDETETQIAFVSAKFAPQGSKVVEVYTLTVGNQKWRVEAQIDGDGKISVTVEGEVND